MNFLTRRGHKGNCATLHRPFKAVLVGSGDASNSISRAGLVRVRNLGHSGVYLRKNQVVPTEARPNLEEEDEARLGTNACAKLLMDAGANDVR